MTHPHRPHAPHRPQSITRQSPSPYQRSEAISSSAPAAPRTAPKNAKTHKPRNGRVPLVTPGFGRGFLKSMENTFGRLRFAIGRHRPETRVRKPGFFRVVSEPGFESGTPPINVGPFADPHRRNRLRLIECMLTSPLTRWRTRRALGTAEIDAGGRSAAACSGRAIGRLPKGCGANRMLLSAGQTHLLALCTAHHPIPSTPCTTAQPIRRRIDPKTPFSAAAQNRSENVPFFRVTQCTNDSQSRAHTWPRVRGPFE